MTARLTRTAVALAALLSVVGCDSQSSPPSEPGVSRPMRYPVLLVGHASLDVRDSGLALTSIPGASTLNLNERRIVDSDGRLFRVVSARPVAGQRSIAWDMGTSTRRFHVEVADHGRPAWAEIQALVIAEVRQPASLWAGDPRAVARVQACRDASELIATSRESWNWAR
jgi:hypothetical protein